MLKQVEAQIDREVQSDAGRESTPLFPLEVANLVLDRDGTRIIRGISATIGADGITVVLGANGSGKTMLLRLLHGLIEPTDGSIAWGMAGNGEAVRLRQAMVFQRPVLLRRSVAANIDFVLGLRGGRDVEKRDELLSHVGLLARASQPAHLLSGGEQQRLALARALATAPDVLFLDEPTASLDPASVHMIEKIVRDADRAGTKIIFVTHDIAQARRLADDVVFLESGQVVERGAAAGFFNRPSTKSASAYLEGRILLPQDHDDREETR
ncbi:MAG: hypothetical protein RLZ98_666 [Pseudomonadota bacterium]|jgi:tungstate transport system ATP-binding protein